MRITIALDAGILKKVQKLTGKKKKSPAVSSAVKDFVRLRERQEFIEKVLSGKTDYSLSNDELEARDLYETR